MSAVPTLSDVAKRAGVSLATVDRVINKRPNVKPRTVERVRQAMADLNYRPDPLAAGLARRKRFRLLFLLPTGTNAFMIDLASQIEGMEAWLAASRASVETVHADVFDPGALTAAIDSLDRSADGAAIVALDHPEVRAALDRLAGDGMPLVTLVSDAPASRRGRFVGVDNAAAGRTAGALIGRFAAGRKGTAGLLVGSLSLRDHMDRCFGFSQVVMRDYPNLTILPIVDTRDDRERAEVAVRDLCSTRHDLVALYNAGAGNQGVARALAQLGDRRPIFVGHELTESSRDALREGTFDALLAQNPGHEVRSAGRILLAKAMGTSVIAEQERIRIDIFIRENCPF